MPTTAATESNQYAGGIRYSSSVGGGSPGTLLFDLPLSTVANFNTQALTFLSTNTQRNQGYLDTQIGRAQAGVDAARGQAFGFMNRGLSSVLAAHYNIGSVGERNLNQQIQMGQFQIANRPSAQVVRQGGCFITTAICESDGLADDCPELTILRAFRDDVMLKRDDTAELVREYYAIAPRIAERLKQMPEDGRRIFRHLRGRYLMPAIHHILRGQYDDAIRIYRNMVRHAQIIAG